MQSQGQPVTAIAYPLDHSLQSSSMGPPPPNMSGNNNSNNQDALDISAILTSSQESIDMGENFFSQVEDIFHYCPLFNNTWHVAVVLSLRAAFSWIL